MPENKDVTITLFKDPRSNEFEDKLWTFSVEDVRLGLYIYIYASKVSFKNLLQWIKLLFTLKYH